MNLLHFLKSTKGAIKTLPALGISAAAGVAFVYTANFAAHQHLQAQRQIRSLSSIAQTAPQEGMRRQGGLLTSINVRDGRNELATAEERAAMGGNTALDRYNANQRALGQMDSFVGRAAASSESDGLGGSGKEADFIGTQYVQGGSANVGGVAAGAVARAQGGAAAGNSAATAGGTVPQAGGPARLAAASMARAGGSSFNASAGLVSSGVAGPTRGAAPVTGVERPRMSGAMPGGTNIVSRMGLDHAQANASFVRGRDGYVTRGQRSGQSQNELKDITRRSAKTAASNTPGANEGAAAFLANSQQSGGVTVEGGTDMSGASSADLAAPTAHKLKAVGNKLKDTGDKMEERNKAQQALLWQTILTLIGSIGMIILGSKVLLNMDTQIEILKTKELAMQALVAFYSSKPYLAKFKAEAEAKLKVIQAKLKTTQILRWAIAGGMMAAVAAANAVLFVKAVEFIDMYGKMGGTTLAKIAIILSPVLVAGMTYTAINPQGSANIQAQLAQKIKKMFDPISMATNSITSGLFK